MQVENYVERNVKLRLQWNVYAFSKEEKLTIIKGDWWKAKPSTALFRIIPVMNKVI
jgi:hypothetical protein